MLETATVPEMFDHAVIRAGDRFPRLHAGKESRSLAHLRSLFPAADALVRALYDGGFRFKVGANEVTICSPRRPMIAFYARPVDGAVSFNFHPTKDARLAHIRLAGTEDLVADTYYCFHRRTPGAIEAFLRLVREAEDGL